MTPVLLLFAFAASDPVVDAVREYARTYDRQLPNFICDQSVRRSEVWRGRGERLVRTFDLEVTVIGGRESYRVLRRDGIAAPPGMQADSNDVGSSGEFSSAMAMLFDAGAEVAFSTQGKAKQKGLQLMLLGVKVDRVHSRWSIGVDKPFKPAFVGTLWVEPESGRVHRIELRALMTPQDHPYRTTNVAIDYGWVVVGDKDVLVPRRSEALSCMASGDCVRLYIEFANYRRFTAESKLIQ